MKLKLSLGEGGLQGFLARHAEKAVFAVVLLVLAGFIYFSATSGKVDAAKSPLDLKVAAERALQSVNNEASWTNLAQERVSLITSDETWESIRDDQQRLPQVYPKKVRDGRSAILEKEYVLTSAWDKQLVPRQSSRKDPKFLAPIQVEASGGCYAVAVRLTRPDDAWSSDKDAVEKPKEAPKPSPSKKKSKSKSPYGMDDPYMMAPGMAPGMGPGLAPGGRGRTSGPGPGMPGMPPGMEGMAPGYEMYGAADPGAMGYPGMDVGGAVGKKRLSKFYIDQYLQGLQPVSGMTARVGARTFYMVSIRALVPYEKQFEEYEQALADAIGYSPAQDVPRYLYFLAERAEVPDDPQAELQWNKLTNTRTAIEEAMEYASFPRELADDAYCLPWVLTMPTPPVLLSPYEKLALHAEIPRKQLRPLMPAAKPTEEGAEPKPDADLSDGIPELPKLPAGGAMGGPYPGAPGMGPEGMPGGYPGYGAPGAEGMMAPGMMAPGMMGPGMMPGYEGAMPGYEGMGPGYPGASGGSGVELPRVKYKLVRFFDRTVEPGKRYRYRVQLVIEDPNRPRNPQADPSRRILEASVVQRLQKVEAADEQYFQKTGKKKRTYYVLTEWSEPSNIVQVESPERVVAGPATAGRRIALSTQTPDIQVQAAESMGKVVAVVWDQRRAAEVPAEKEVYLGAVLNFKQNAEALHPLTWQIKVLEDYKFATNAFIADLTGGEELLKLKDGDQQTVLHAPGEFVVIDRHGNVTVANEIDDAEEYRRLLFKEDTPAGGAVTGPGMPYGPEPGGMEGYPGGEFFGPGPGAGA